MDTRSFLLKLSKEVTETVPEKIKIKDLPKYLNPRMIEPLINKILSESTMYDDDTMRSISELYLQSNNSQKRKIFDTVAKGQDVTNLLQPKQTETIRISI